MVHFAQDSATRRGHSASGGGSSGGGGASAYNTDPVSNTSAAGNGLFRADSAGEERLGEMNVGMLLFLFFVLSSPVFGPALGSRLGMFVENSTAQGEDRVRVHGKFGVSVLVALCIFSCAVSFRCRSRGGAAVSTGKLFRFPPASGLA